MLRRLLPFAIVAPLLFGWLRLELQDADLVGLESGVALLTLAFVTTTVALLMLIAYSLNRVDERRRAAEAEVVAAIAAQRHDEARFRMAVEASPGGMIMVDATGRVILANAEAERMFGYEPGALDGESVDRLVPKDLRPGHVDLRTDFVGDPQKRAMGQGRDLFGERQDGTAFPIEVGLNPIATPEGTVVLATVVDITERKAAEDAIRRHAAELERSNAELEQFAYVASHDLQEPLRMVASYTQLLEDRYGGQLDERAHKYINYAVDGAHRMQTLISDLLVYSRVGTRAKPLRPVAAGSVVEQVLRDMRGAIRQSDATVQVDELPTVLADEVQLGQVFQNLIGNAIKFRSEEPPVVVVQAVPSDGMVEFAIEDNGIGIDPEHAERIFQMFQRLHERGKYEGSGIGLSVAKKIVERHGGRIWFEANDKGGTTFRFTLAPVTGPAFAAAVNGEEGDDGA
jgi:PAS domain S-box-containing protein